MLLKTRTDRTICALLFALDGIRDVSNRSILLYSYLLAFRRQRITVTQKTDEKRPSFARHFGVFRRVSSSFADFRRLRQLKGPGKLVQWRNDYSGCRVFYWKYTCAQLPLYFRYMRVLRAVINPRLLSVLHVYILFLFCLRPLASSFIVFIRTYCKSILSTY